MARSRSMRRRSNGVGPYHMYLGRLLKAAKLKGKSKKERAAAFKKAVAQAKAQAKKGFSKDLSKGVAAKNAAIKALRAKRRAKRAAASGASAAAAPSRRRRVAAASKRPASVKGTRMVKAKGGRVMYFVDGKIASKAVYEAAKGGAARPASAKKAPSRKRRAAAKSASKAPARKAASKAKAAPKRKAASKAKGASKGKRKGVRRRKNTGLASVLDGVKQFGRDALTLQGLGGAAVVGVAHGFVAPMVADYLAEMFPQTIKVPVLDVDVSASTFAFTATGLVAGAALAGLGYAAGRPMLGLGLGALAFSSGVVIDTVGLVQSRQASAEDAVASLGDVAYGDVAYGDVAYGAIDNDGMVYGDVAYGAIDNQGTVYGDVAYGGVMGAPGMDYGTMCASEYADAAAADAEESGADFSEEDGQALMDGPLAWLRRFGRPPRRMTGIRGRKSRHAGRAGHRWGWLIKLVGMEKAAQIAALSPEKRLKVIAALRKQAIESLSAMMAESASMTTEATVAAANERVPPHLLLPPPPMRPNLLSPAQAMGLDLMATGAGGAMGAGGYGSVVYAGSGF